MPKLGYKYGPMTKEHKRRLHKFPKGKENPSWKGSKISYRGVHKYIEKQLGRPHFCENCGNRNLDHRQYHWANISRTYKRITNDWRRLCAKCHKAFDRKSSKS